MWDILCSFVAPYINLYAFTYRRLCNLRQSLACGSIDIFLTTGSADLSRYISDNNGCIISSQRDRRSTLFGFSKLAYDALHKYTHALTRRIFMYYTIEKDRNIEVKPVSQSM